MQLGPLTVRELGQRVPKQGQTAKKVESTGIATLYEVAGPGATLELSDTSWANGDRDLKTSSRCESPERFDPLVGRLRFSVEAVGGDRLKMRLRIPRSKAYGDRPTMHQVTLDELERRTRLPVADLLKDVGADAVGPGHTVLGHQSQSQNELYVVFDESKHYVPVIAYALTPILAIWDDLR